MLDLRGYYLSIELRTLAILRIALGSLLLFDLTKRIPGIGLWYVNSGLLPNHRVLWHPGPYQFSYLFALWTIAQVRIAFVVIAFVYVCFLFGFRTRLFHILSWLSLLSLHTRANFVANGGDYVFCTLLLWTLFMPLGSRWSFDALRTQARSGSSNGEAFVSLAVAALRAQLWVIYVFNALHKTGRTWRDGSAVHYMLHQARIVTELGIWVRDNAPIPVLRALAYGTLVFEYLIPILIVLPWLAPWPRRIAIVLIWSLHLPIALLANLGVFSPVMLVFSLCLLDAGALDWFASRERIARAFTSLAQRLRPLCEALPLLERDRQSSGALRIRTWVRELVAGFLMLCATSQLINENPRLLGKLAHEPPAVITATIAYLRLNQGWAMFAPNAPRTNMWMVVDAVTQSGRHIDPYNLRASVVADPGLRSIPGRLGQNVFFCDYTARIEEEQEFHEPLHDWILNHGQRVHRPDENILRFDAYVVEQRSPPLGQLRPSDVKTRVFLSGSQAD